MLRRLAVALASIIAAVGSAPAAMAADFYLIQGNQNQISLIDQSAIRTEANGHFTAPVVAIRRSRETMRLNFAYAVLPTEFDCENRQIQSASMTLYLADGQEAPQQLPPNTAPSWIRVEPGSQGEGSLRFVCAMPEQRQSLAFSMRGLSLGQIVTAVFDGSWPVDDALAHLRDAASKP
jgi:hypothetical protein